jgi:hypothetical protein
MGEKILHLFQNRAYIVKPLKKMVSSMFVVGLAYQGKDIIVFRSIIEYSSLRDFYKPLGNNNNNNGFNFIGGFLKDEILACVIETLRLVIIEL